MRCVVLLQGERTSAFPAFHKQTTQCMLSPDQAITTTTTPTIAWAVWRWWRYSTHVVLSGMEYYQVAWLYRFHIF